MTVQGRQHRGWTALQMALPVALGGPKVVGGHDAGAVLGGVDHEHQAEPPDGVIGQGRRGRTEAIEDPLEIGRRQHQADRGPTPQEGREPLHRRRFGVRVEEHEGTARVDRKQCPGQARALRRWRRPDNDDGHAAVHEQPGQSSQLGVHGALGHDGRQGHRLHAPSIGHGAPSPPGVVQIRFDARRMTGIHCPPVAPNGPCTGASDHR